MKIFGIGSIIVIFVWLLGFFYFLKITEEELTINRSITDAIVVIGQKKSNLNSGVQLLKLGYSPFIFITTNYNKDDFENYFKLNKLASEQFIFSSQIDAYQENVAITILNFITKYKFKSLRIIADNVAMPRILIEISQVLPKDIIIIPHPIANNKKYGDIIKEYTKYIYILFTSLIGYRSELNLSYS
ncbi:MAG: hypothetical protein EKK61_04085 [Rickettsiales bacterium]|nr:MAG: hypothetical protein EKK61_04085 [Rickettsiales bacterium]